MRERIDCNPLTINFYRTTTTEDGSTFEDRQSKNTKFMYFQLFVDILIKMDSEHRDLSGKADLVDGIVSDVLTKPLDVTDKQDLVSKLLQTLIENSNVDASIKQEQIDALRKIQVTSSSSSPEDCVIQILEIIRPNSSRLAAKEDLIDYFKEIYRSNKAQENLIVDFETNYRTHCPSVQH